jgi:hypothetical protein
MLFELEIRSIMSRPVQAKAPDLTQQLVKGSTAFTAVYSGPGALAPPFLGNGDGNGTTKSIDTSPPGSWMRKPESLVLGGQLDAYSSHGPPTPCTACVDDSVSVVRVIHFRVY